MNEDNVLADGLVKVPAAAAFLSISVAQVYRLMERGELPYCKIGKSRRVPKRALIELAAGRMVNADQS